MVSAARRRTRGFTIPELLTVVAIVAILASVAAPALSSMIASTRSRSVSSELYASLARARSEAIKRNAEVTLAPLSARQWEQGWSIADPNHAGAKLDDHPAVVGATVSGPASVIFLPNGRVKSATLPAFDIAMSGNDTRRCVKIDLAGRPSQTTSAC